MTDSADQAYFRTPRLQQNRPAGWHKILAVLVLSSKEVEIFHDAFKKLWKSDAIYSLNWIVIKIGVQAGCDRSAGIRRES
jgi:hypothetical protein